MPAHSDQPSRFSRALNAAIALAVAAALSPVLAVIAALVRIDSRGPVIYRETRLGKNGAPFRIFKFRTIRDGDGQHELVAPLNDPRITRFGAWLRPRHLDELPQLFNIIRGEMRFVGPRAAKPEFWAAIDPDLRRRALAFVPGMTSPASIRFLCEDTVLAELDGATAAYRDIIFPAKVAMDVRHFERAGRWSDLKVLAATVAAVIRRHDDGTCRRRLERLLAAASADRHDTRGTERR